jgi:hypothetical protein
MYVYIHTYTYIHTYAYTYAYKLIYIYILRPWHFSFFLIKFLPPFFFCLLVFLLTTQDGAARV